MENQNFLEVSPRSVAVLPRTHRTLINLDHSTATGNWWTTVNSAVLHSVKKMSLQHCSTINIVTRARFDADTNLVQLQVVPSSHWYIPRLKDLRPARCSYQFAIRLCTSTLVATRLTMTTSSSVGELDETTALLQLAPMQTCYKPVATVELVTGLWVPCKIPCARKVVGLF